PQLGDADRSRPGGVPRVTGSLLEVRVGTRLWFDGEGWAVCEVRGTSVRLQGDGGRYRTAAVTDLLEGASGLDPDSHAVDARQGVLLSAIGLQSLTLQQRTRLEAEVEIFAELLAVRGADEAPARMRSAATKLGLSLRTVQRRLRRFDELGPAGLIDER